MDIFDEIGCNFLVSFAATKHRLLSSGNLKEDFVNLKGDNN